MTQTHETAKNVIDIVSVVAAIGSFLDILTPVFGLIGAVWTLMRISEMVMGKPFSEIIGRKKSDAKHE